MGICWLGAEKALTKFDVTLNIHIDLLMDTVGNIYSIHGRIFF